MSRKLIVAALAAGFVILPQTASAQETPATNGAGNEEAKSYAAQFNVSIGEATRRLALQRKASRLQEKLRSENPDSFAGLYVENSGKFRIVTRFKGSGAAEKLKRGTQDPELLAETESEEAAETLPEAKGRQQRLIAQLKRAGVTADGGYDIKAGTVVLYVLDKADAESKLKAASVQLGDRVRLEQVESFIVPTALYGGYTVATQTPSYLRNCTSGFNVQNASGVKGVMTAGHCYNDAKYFTSKTATYGTSGGTLLTFKGEANTGNDDYQWHTASGQTYPAQFYDGVALKSVTVSRPQMWAYAGEYVCKYGITTGRTCGSVVDTMYWDNSYGGYYAHVSSGGVMNKEGDSGGPVFVGTEAYGIVHGRNAAYDLFYMGIELQTLGLTVLTQP